MPARSIQRGLAAAAAVVALLCRPADAGAANTCSLVEMASQVQIEPPVSLEFSTQLGEYWSRACGDLKPSCMLVPKTTPEVADVVRILNTQKETFAIKSGGWNANPHFASVRGGPLVVTKLLNQVQFDEAAGTVCVGAGNRWDDVLKALDSSGYTVVVGGSAGQLSVGGSLLGGGLSPWSAQYGWAASSVLEYTLVLANASVVRVTRANYPDIFTALTAGGSNYGIITSYLLKVYPQGQVWGGKVEFEAKDTTTPALFAALRDFTQHYPDDKAAVVLTAERTPAIFHQKWSLSLYYNGAQPPAGVFDSFLAIEHTSDSCRTQSMRSLINDTGHVGWSTYTTGTETTPLPSHEDALEVFQAYYDHWANMSNAAAVAVAGTSAALSFQPLPKAVARAAKAKGVDLYDLDEQVDRVVLGLRFAFQPQDGLERVQGTMQEACTGLQAQVQSFQSRGKLSKAYLPLLVNEAFHRQDYFGRLRPEMGKLARAVREQLDPTGMWRDRTSGFKP